MGVLQGPVSSLLWAAGPLQLPLRAGAVALPPYSGGLPGAFKLVGACPNHLARLGNRAGKKNGGRRA